MSRRARAILFLVLAGMAAALAAAVADSYGSRMADEYGRLRPVVVAMRGLPSGKPLTPKAVSSSLEVRRVPLRFVPAGTLKASPEAIGLAPTADLSAGSYLVAAQLRPPTRKAPAALRVGPRRRPVEISVTGAEALLSAGPPDRQVKVDVIVTTEGGASGRGRTYVAVAAVPLLALRPGVNGPSPGGIASATLALTKRQALRLIDAESFARKLTILPEG